jgi:aldehyde dehydrogenase (NAD+)
MTSLAATTSAADLLERLGVDPALVTDGDLGVRTPITGDEIARVARTGEEATSAAVARAVAAFEAWRDVPAPRRGELVRLLGEELRREKEALGALVTLEVGKISQEGLGEVESAYAHWNARFDETGRLVPDLVVV